MVNRTCIKCNAVFYRKSNYEKHLKKKFDCTSKINKTNLIICDFVQNKKELDKFSKSDLENFNNINETSNNLNKTSNNLNETSNLDFLCYYCNKNFSSKYTLIRHKKDNCKLKKDYDEKNEKENTLKLLLERDKENKEKIEKLEKEKKSLTTIINKSIPETKEIMNIHKSIKKLETIIPANTNLTLNNQFLEQIIQKDKMIENLTKKSNEFNLISKENKEELENEINNKDIEKKQIPLILNEFIIEYRKSDGYVNATQLCKAGEKNFNDWLCLENTKKYLIEMETDTKLTIKHLIDNNNKNDQLEIWIYPKIAINLTHWLNPEFVFNVSNWIFDYLFQDKIIDNIKLLNEKEDIIKDYKKRIKYLEKTTLKKHSRNNLDKKFNVIYLITCDELEVNRKYIIGKAKDLLNRLSQYDKMSNYRVIYSKPFKNEKDMNFAELIVLNGLEKYKDQMNRDRFILPVGKNIDFFTMAFDDASKCFMY
jgi:hypothetical protein